MGVDDTTQYKPLLPAEQRAPLFPERPFYKFLVLFFISLVCFGSYFAYDEIQNFEPNIRSDLHTDHAGFGLLYSLYSFPNWVLPFFGGLLGDKIGLRLAALVYVSLVVAGAVVVALGPQLAVNGLIAGSAGYGIMLAGRVIFGCGAESLNVIQTSMVATWFKSGTSLAFAMSLTLSVARLGDFLSLAISNQIATAVGSWVSVMWIGACLCGVSMFAVFMYSILDKAAERVLPDRAPVESENPLNFKAVLHFDRRFWVIALLCMSYYSGIFPFVAVASDFLTTVYGMDATTAGWYSSVVTLASMCLSPVLGKVLDRVGNRPYFIVIGSCFVVPCHLWLAFAPHNFPPLIPIIVMGLSFSIVPCALWPCIPVIIADLETATAFGLMAAIQNCGLSLMNYAANAIVDSDPSYRSALLFFTGMDGVGVVCGIILIFMDRRMGGQLCAVRTKATVEAEAGSKPLVPVADGTVSVNG